MMQRNISLFKEVITEPNQIFETLQHGINLPVKNDFSDLVLAEIKGLNMKSLVLKDDLNRILGHTIYFEDQDTLYFGFFKAKNDNKKYISVLLEELEEIASNRNVSIIKGPINPPPMIFGFGFSEAGSDTSIAAGTPYTDPIYIKKFKTKGYDVWHRFFWYNIPIRNTGQKIVWPVQSGDFQNTDWIFEMLDLQSTLFPESAQITPKRNLTVHQTLQFIKKYGYEECFYLVYDEGKMAGFGYCSPNPYDLNELNKCQSVLLMGTAIQPRYQGKHLLTSMFAKFADNCERLGIYHGEWVVGEDNVPSIMAAKSFGGKKIRSYVILEKTI
ncbi:MAG: GNAT family N-acetyltransferase [Candidatus Lokiarchaeota archaeon]|nr:GNAT family N-acetyltransferase [Candidatus Lokiarchaeota archaeon]